MGHSNNLYILAKEKTKNINYGMNDNILDVDNKYLKDIIFILYYKYIIFIQKPNYLIIMVLETF